MTSECFFLINQEKKLIISLAITSIWYIFIIQSIWSPMTECPKMEFKLMSALSCSIKLSPYLVNNKYETSVWFQNTGTWFFLVGQKT